jgi:eukaryotic-like serine/threonine-protein kinase
VVQGGSNIAAGVREGDVLAGKYRVERVLGAGGMGVVVAALHIQLEERVALKFLLPEALGDAEAVARFVREARAAVKIKSEHIARVLDVGTLETGAPYIVMEYLEGGDLAAWIKQRGALPVELAVEFVLQACVAVADAHALGIIHRDLKPANLFCVRRSDGQFLIKVLDFGISKLTDMSGSTSGMAMTKTSSLMGSPLYMSPEQMRSAKDVDAGTDIWALGIILFELMTGRPAFRAGSVTELAIKVANDPPPSLRSFRPDLLPGLEAVVFRCLEKDRRMRYSNVGELALALLPFAPRRAKGSVERISGIIQAGGLSTSALAVPQSPTGPSETSGGTLPAVGRTIGARRGRAAVIGVSALGVVGAVAVTASFMLVKKAPANLERPQAAASQPSIPAVPQAPGPTAPLTPTAARLIDPAAVTALMDLPRVAPPPSAETTRKINRPASSAPSAMAAPAVSQPSAAVPAAKSNCNPPYFFDSANHKQYKPECF